MSVHIDNGKHAKLCRKMQPAFALLLEALECADDAKCDLWEFAVGIHTLQELGLSEIDFRWLVRSGYVEHAREITLSGDHKRQFRPEGEPVFCKRTCFVLSKKGVSKAQLVTAHHSRSLDDAPKTIYEEDLLVGNGKTNGNTMRELVPYWDEETHELRLNTKMVKRYKWQAVNQQLLLRTFQEEGWPTRIDDPLPPQLGQDSKRRLSDTIRCLNRKQQNALIRFRGDGSGEGIIWELVSDNKRKD